LHQTLVFRPCDVLFVVICTFVVLQPEFGLPQPMR
jgi:hypothetical protein